MDKFQGILEMRFEWILKNEGELTTEIWDGKKGNLKGLDGDIDLGDAGLEFMGLTG